MPAYLDDFEDDCEPKYDHFVILTAKQLRYLTNAFTCLVMLLAFACVPIFIIILIQGTATNEATATKNSPCARLVPGGRCVGFFSPVISDHSIINFARQPENETLPMCPLTMHCVSLTPELLFFSVLNNTSNASRNSTLSHVVINTEAASRYVISVPEKSFLTDATDYMRFFPFCKKQGGVIPKPFLWLLLQSVLSTVFVLATNVMMTTEWAHHRMAQSVACVAMVRFRFKRWIQWIRSLYAGDDNNNSELLSLNTKLKVNAEQQQEDSQQQQSSQSVFIEAEIAERASQARRETLSFTRRCFRMSTATGVMAIFTLVTGVVYSVHISIDAENNRNNNNRYNNTVSNVTSGMWRNFDTVNELDGAFGIFATWSAALFNTSCLAGFISLGAVLIIHLSAWAWDAFDAAMFVVMTEWLAQGTTGTVIGCCCFGICWWRLLWLLLCKVTAVACDYVFGCVAPLYSTLSYLLRGLTADAGKDEYMPTTVLTYGNMFVLVTGVSWAIFCIPGLVLFGPLLFVMYCAFLFITLGSVLGLSFLTIFLRVRGTRLLPKTGKLRPVYFETFAVQFFAFTRLAWTTFLYSIIGYYACSQGTNSAIMAYGEDLLSRGPTLWASVPLREYAARSHGCFAISYWNDYRAAFDTLTSLF